jgi:hypothetical protein
MAVPLPPKITPSEGEKTWTGPVLERLYRWLVEVTSLLSSLRLANTAWVTREYTFLGTGGTVEIPLPERPVGIVFLYVGRADQTAQDLPYNWALASSGSVLRFYSTTNAVNYQVRVLLLS